MTKRTKRLTKKEALRYSRNIWVQILTYEDEEDDTYIHPDAKEHTVEDLGLFGMFVHNCPCCQYVQDKRLKLSEGNCTKYCLAIDLWTEYAIPNADGDYQELPCLREGSPYRDYECGVYGMRITDAKIIADFFVKKYAEYK